MNPKLILLYGAQGSVPNKKIQGHLDGKRTCGYREYARCGGYIIYMSPQSNATQSWEKTFPMGKGVADFCNSFPDAVVWSVKYEPGKATILREVENFKIYYSCNARNSVDKYCDVGLVDTPERISHPKHRLHLKGKDPDFWKPLPSQKPFDYLMMGVKSNKNQHYFLKRLQWDVKSPRKVLWIGGDKGISQHGIHELHCTGPIGPQKISALIPAAKVGFVYSEIPAEGFPQSFLEMTMCGVPVVYGGPMNPRYFFPENSVVCKKKEVAVAAEHLRDTLNVEACRQVAEREYSIYKSIDYLVSLRDGGE